MRYAVNNYGNVIDLFKKRLLRIQTELNGYNTINICIDKKQNKYLFHRFIWESYNGLTPEGKTIDHRDNDKNNNKLSNLNCCTQQENCKKSYMKRDYTFAANNHKNKQIVKSTCIETGEIDYFHSLYSVQRDLKINCGILKMCCEGLNRVKSGISKLNGNSYRFEYIDALPDNYNREIKLRGIKYKKKKN